MSDAEGAGSVLSATHVIEYPYTRSLGPALGRFLAGLRDRRIVGSRTGSGVVHVPPLEFDPDTAATIDEYVEVAPAGEVVSWAWVARPGDRHPLDRPFAFALIRLDGADGAFLHVVDAGGPENMKSGMRVAVRWADERSGSVKDIACFVPEEAR